MDLLQQDCFSKIIQWSDEYYNSETILPRNIQYLQLSGQSCLELPNEIGCLVNLVEMSIADCHELIELTENIGSLYNL